MNISFIIIILLKTYKLYLRLFMFELKKITEIIVGQYFSFDVT